MAHDVFISYSNHDKSVADAACAVVEHHGVRCWIAPRDVTPGADWSAEIVDAIHGSRLLVLVYSARANTSPQIQREVERAVSIGIPILPFRIEDVPMSKSLEYFISSRHWLDALTPPLERHLDYLARTVQLLLSRLGPEPAHPVARPADDATAPTRAPAAATPVIQKPASPASPTVPANGRMTSRPARRWLPAAAVAVLLLAGLGVRQWLTRSAGGTAPDAPAIPGGSNAVDNGVVADPAGARGASAADPARARNAGAAVDPAITGGWTFRTQNQAGTWVSTLDIDPLGHYRTRATIHDRGQVSIGPGWFRMVSMTQNVIAGTYRSIDASTVEITSQNRAVRWSRVPGAPMPQGPTGWAGTWQATASINGVPWSQTIINSPDGRYTLTSVSEDAGQLTAAGGQYHMTSRTGVVTDGTYQLNGARSLSLTGPLGPSVWMREQ